MYPLMWCLGRKGILRLAEKQALRPTSGLIWDCVRAMLVGHTLDELSEALGPWWGPWLEVTTCKNGPLVVGRVVKRCQEMI